MNVSLTKELEAMVQEKVQSGLYNSASEVIREALRLLNEREYIREMRLAELRKDVQAALEQADRGEVAPFDIEAIKAKARARFKGAR